MELVSMPLAVLLLVALVAGALYAIVSPYFGYLQNVRTSAKNASLIDHINRDVESKLTKNKPAPTKDGEPLFCPNCGGRNNRENNFCEACGKKLR